jgi:hypothetical protein
MLWGFGNTIVIEHELRDSRLNIDRICSVYFHLSDRRLVSTGDTVSAGEPIGYIGRGDSRENGGYPRAHLHFGIHKGPYFQLPKSYWRYIRKKAVNEGIPVRVPDDSTQWVRISGMQGKWGIVRGELNGILHEGGPHVTVLFADGTPALCSMNMKLTGADTSPPGLMFWCRGYADERETVSEWIRPSAWLEKHAAEY